MEQQIIKALRALGFDLANKTEGGEGISGLKHSAETKAKIGAANTGRKISDVTREKMRVGVRNRPPVSAVTRAKMSAAKGEPSDETRAKMRAGHKNRQPISEVTRARIVAASSNCSVETRAKRSASMMGREVTAETRSKMSESAKNRPPISDETRAKISAVSTAYWLHSKQIKGETK